MEFYERVKTLAKQNRITIEGAAEAAGISRAQYYGYKKHGNLPRADEAANLAKELNTSVEYLVFGKESTRKDMPSGLVIRDDKGREIEIDSELCLLPILSQKVAAGMGQAMIDDVEIVGQLPFLNRMLRGEQPAGAKALEVRGDSMTGVNIFDGDMVVFIPGIIRGDGIYVLAVGDELIVKRVEFDAVSRKIHIMSENPRYKDRVESADGQTLRVVGKVFGWVHAHPY